MTYREGKLSGPVVNGNYHAPVSFAVSSTGTDLLGFTDLHGDKLTGSPTRTAPGSITSP
jgi:hypothetical protein